MATNAVASASSARATAGPANVASFSRGQIDELSPSAALAFDEHSYLLPDEFGDQLPEHHGQDLPQRQQGAVPQPTTNETFSNIFRLAEVNGEFQGTEVEEKPFVKGPKGFAGLLQKAVNTYELNSAIIHGEHVPRGSNLRLVL